MQRDFSRAPHDLVRQLQAEGDVAVLLIGEAQELQNLRQGSEDPLFVAGPRAERPVAMRGAAPVPGQVLQDAPGI